MRYIILILLVMSLSIAGCGNDSDIAKNDHCSYQVVDDFGDVIKFDSKPKRVYATTLSIEEVLIGLLEPERFAAISEDALNEKYSLIVQEASLVKNKVPAKINVESILALNPDLVIVQANTNKAQIDALKDLGLKVFVTKVPTNLNMVEARIKHIAEAIGEPERGVKIVQEMNKKISVVKNSINKIPYEQRKIAMAYSLLGAFGSKQGLYHDICEQAGLRNGAAMAGLNRGEHLSKEKIVSVNPDILIFPHYSSTQKGDVDKLRQDVLNDPSLQTVKAVKEKKFIIINDRYRYSASQYIADAIVTISEQAYPEFYKNSYICNK